MEGRKSRALRIDLFHDPLCLNRSGNHRPSDRLRLTAPLGISRSEKFKEVRANALRKAVLEQMGGVADAGEPFNSTDVTDDPAIPSKSLIVAASALLHTDRVESRLHSTQRFLSYRMGLLGQFGTLKGREAQRLKI